jgi:uncharacterized protein (TIGR04255 family)
VALAQQPALSGPLLSDVLGEWFQNHPRVETAAPYEMPPESSGLAGTLPGVQFQVIMAAPTAPRYWLVSQDDNEVVQVQANYLALNWRRRDLAQDYPGYEVLRERFVALMEAAEIGLRRFDGTLKPTRVEITYINVIQPDAIWSSHDETHKLVKVSVPGGTPYERLSFSYSQALADEKGKFVGRLHVLLNPTADWVKQEPQIGLTLTARSTDLGEQNVETALRFLDLAHDAANKAFLDLLTETARRTWGLA